MSTKRLQQHYASIQADQQIQSLFHAPQDPEQLTLAQRFCPILRFDTKEPFLPIAISYSILQPNSKSPSTPRQFGELTASKHPFDRVIEYAIWWDWDIGHLYELEHVWVYLDEFAHAIGYEASNHGNYHNLYCNNLLQFEGTHPIIYSEPGKHAFANKSRYLHNNAQQNGNRRSTVELAGLQGILLNEMFAQSISYNNTDLNRVYRYLVHQAFEPSWQFTLEYRFQPQQFVPWPALKAWIPQRLQSCLEQLAENPPPPAPLKIGMQAEPLGGLGHRTDLLLKWLSRDLDLLGVTLYRTLDQQLIAAPQPVLYNKQQIAHQIAHLTFAELSELELTHQFPTFAELAQTCYQYRIRLYIEVHDWQTLQLSIPKIAQTGLGNYVIIGSDRADWLNESKAHLPNTRTLLKITSQYSDPLALAQACQADIILPNQPPSEEQIAKWQAHGISVAAWQDWPNNQRYDMLFGNGRYQRQASKKQVLAICIDCGDTLIDEGSEYKQQNDVSLRAELIPGAAQLIKQLRQRGYPLALVADGPIATFHNLLGHYQLYDEFDVYAISEQVGVSKPDPRIFQHALNQLGIEPHEYSRVLMLGNNLAVDIKGANQLGMISVWLDWAPRRSKHPADPSEQPLYIIKEPLNLIKLLEQLEQQGVR